MSQIEWTDETWNPLVGCTRISHGCDHCYAIKIAHRFNHRHYDDTTEVNLERGTTDWTGVVNRAPAHIVNRPLKKHYAKVKGPDGEPLRDAKGKLVKVLKSTVYFVNSMSDMFHDQVSDADLTEIFSIMNEASRHTFQVLTKRPSRMLKKTRELGLKWTPNIWAGTSIESDKYAVPRVRELEKVPATVRFVSAEPLLGPLPSLDVSKIDWLIIGGESGNEGTVRAMDPAWVRDLVDRSRRAGTPVFFKQWGKWGEDGIARSKTANGHLLAGEEIFEMPADAYDRLKANGRAPDPRWTRIPKRAMQTPASRLEASANLYVIDGVVEPDEDEFVLQKMIGKRDAYENPQRLKKLVSAPDKERLDLEAQWAALGVEM